MKSTGFFHNMNNQFLNHMSEYELSAFKNIMFLINYIEIMIFAYYLALTNKKKSTFKIRKGHIFLPGHI